MAVVEKEMKREKEMQREEEIAHVARLQKA